MKYNGGKIRKLSIFLAILSIALGNLILPLTGRSQCCLPDPAGLVSLYRGEGNASDEFNLNPGTLINAGFTSGVVGQGFSFSGSASYVSIPASSSLDIGAGGSLTVECWIQPFDFTRAQQIVEWDDGNGNFGVQLAHSQQDLGGPAALFANLIDTQGASHYFFSSAHILNSTSFQHVALTYDKSTGQAIIYLNGRSVAAQGLGSFTPRTSLNVLLGGRQPADNFFNGVIDEVGLYSRALAASEILAIYNAGSAGKCGVAGPSGMAPAITNQSPALVAAPGSTLSLFVGAFGCPSTDPLFYQWLTNNVIIPGATNSTLTLTNIQNTQQTVVYAMTVSNSTGVTTSFPIYLTVADACDPAPANLVAWYAAESNAQDGFSTFAGTLNNVNFAPGKVGTAFSFSGVSNYVGIPASPFLNVGTNSGMTIECWIKPADFTRAQQLVEWDNNTGGFGTQLGHSQPGLGGGASLFVNLTDTSSASHFFNSAVGLLNSNSFQHVAVTYDQTSGQGILYYNGQAVVTTNLGIFTPQTSFNLNLGGRIPAANFYNGLLDEVSIYSRALSASEIQAIYLAGGNGKCAPSPQLPTIISWPSGTEGIPGQTVLLASRPTVIN